MSNDPDTAKAAVVIDGGCYGRDTAKLLAQSKARMIPHTLDETQYCLSCEETGKQLKAAWQRELELLAVIEKQHKLLSNALKYPAQRFEPSQALHEHDDDLISKVCSIVYGQCASDNVAQRTVDAIRLMAEERRKK